MQSIIDLYKVSETLHHAYFFVANKVTETAEKLKHFLETVVGVKIVGNPDVSHYQFKTLTIDHARALAEAQERKGLTQNNSASRKVFIIETDFITEEAQNALLKVFEEPTSGTHFFIISLQDMLLPTLRSRVHLVLSDNVSRGTLDTNQAILSLNLAERLARVKEITEDISDEKKTKQDAIALLNQVERELYEIGVEKKSRELKICENTREALYDRGAPVKIILENVMLSI